MKTIYKYPLSDGANRLIIPTGAKPVFVGMEDGRIWPTVWIEHSTDNKKDLTPLTLEIFGTGFNIPDDAIYVGTVRVRRYVWHVYQVVSVESMHNISEF